MRIFETDISSEEIRFPRISRVLLIITQSRGSYEEGRANTTTIARQWKDDKPGLISVYRASKILLNWVSLAPLGPTSQETRSLYLPPDNNTPLNMLLCLLLCFIAANLYPILEDNRNEEQASDIE